jgi:23S rRNA pseudouridine2605 synthase
VYYLVLNKPLTVHDVRRIKSGVRLHDGVVAVDNVVVVPGTNGCGIKLELHSGKYRVVRRLFERIGYYVCKLDRTGYAGLTKHGLRLGGWRFLTAREIKMLKSYSME